MTGRILWGLLALFFAAAEARADPEPGGWVDPGWRRLVARYAVTFGQDGLSRTVIDFEILALNARGAETIAQQSFNYNSHFGELAVSNLTTIKADGRVIPVDPRAIRDQPTATETSSPYFDEERTRIIAYSDVAAGDKVTGRAVYTDKLAHFPGQFAQFWVQPQDQPPEVLELTVDGPASMPLQTSAQDVEHRVEQLGDRIIHHVRFTQQTPRSRAIGLDAFDSARRFEASTFAGYAALAGMLRERNAPMARPTEVLRRFAAEIVGDAATTADKVERLHNWVTQTIRYVGIGLEDGGLTSQPAESVLAARYGDCKAHATLLKALLAAQGIAADLVAINSGARYRITEVATQNFDHVIIYVPELDQYLDPTASLVAFGALPSDLGGKPALDIDRGEVVTLPLTPAERFSLTSDSEVTLAPDGARIGRTVLGGRGLGAALSRAMVRRSERMDRRRGPIEMLNGERIEDSPDPLAPDVRQLADSYAAITSYRLKPIPLDAPLRLSALVTSDPRPSPLELATAGVRRETFRCQSVQYVHTVTLHLADGVSLASKQAAVSHAADLSGETVYGPVHGRIEVGGEITDDKGTVRATSRLLVRFDGPVCPADFAGSIEKAWIKFDQFRRAAISLSTKPVGYVLETSPELDAALEAYNRKDYQLALSRFWPLAKAGHPKARAYIGFMHEYAYGVARDYSEAARWYRMSAEQGDTYSQAKLAGLYANGLGVARDDTIAAEWYARAARLGDRQAQLHLATFYRDGRGVGRDLKQAETWFALAAEQGSGWAQMSIGLLYTKGGDGLPVDYGKAVEWFRKAAANDDATAKYNLGWAYEAGLGVPRNNEQAIEWYRKAADQGDQLAKERLARLTSAGSPSLPAGRLIGGLLNLLSSRAE
ncbi:DUF3857 domain-containing protein [Bradyrhizobium sp. USDA 4353]